MRRRKRFTLVRIALALTVAAIVPVAAQAKLAPTVGNHVPAEYQVGPGEIPYMSQGHGASATDFGLVLGSDDRSFSRATAAAAETRVEIPYMSQGAGVTSAELGFAVGNSPDDRPYSRTTSLDNTQVVSDGGMSIDADPYTVTGLGVALLLVMGGIGLGIRHNRKVKLSPA